MQRIAAPTGTAGVAIEPDLSRWLTHSETALRLRMVNVQAGPNDVPGPCPRCRTMTLHRPGADGQLHCLNCLMASMQPALRPQVMAPPPHVAQPQPVVQVIQTHQPEGGVVRGTINAAKFVFSLIFLLFVGTCVYTCAEVSKDTHHHSP